MAKVAQSATTTWRNQCHIIKNVGSGTFFKQKKFTKMFFNFFFIGTKIIFKPKNHVTTVGLLICIAGE